MTPSHVSLLLLLSVLWSASFTLTKVAVIDVPPITTVTARLIIATVAIALYMRAAGVRWPPFSASWRLYGVLAATGNAIPFFLIAWGMQRIDSALAAILIGATPILTMFIAHWATEDEPLRPRSALGVGLGFCGILVLIGPDVIAGLGGGTLAKLAIIGAALSYAINVVLARRLDTAPAPASGAITALSALMMLPVCLIAEAPWSIAPTATAVTAIIGLGVLSTALATLIFLFLVAHAGATFTALVNYLIPLLGVLWGVLFLGEQPGPLDGLALALIVAAIFLVNRGYRPSTSRMP